MKTQHIKAELYRIYGRKWLSEVSAILGEERHVIDQVVKHRGLESSAKRMRVAVELAKILKDQADIDIESTFPEIADCIKLIADRKSCAA
jgi:hypothetical protein